MYRIKFQGESLETFSVYDVVKGAINAYLRVAGSPEPAPSVRGIHDFTAPYDRWWGGKMLEGDKFGPGDRYR